MEEEKDKSKGAAAEMCWNWDEVFTPDHQCGDVESVVAKPLEDDKEIAMVAEKVKSVEIEKVLEIVESPKVEEVLAPPRTLTAYLCYNCTLPENARLKDQNTFATTVEVKDTLPENVQPNVISEKFDTDNRKVCLS